jgi:hypothetical protein
MKILYLTLGVGLFFTATTHLNAAKMEVNPLGEMTILPIEKRCEVNVSTPEIDYGIRTSGQLERLTDGKKLTFGKRYLTLNIFCPFNQVMRVVLRSNRDHEGQFQFGGNSSMRLRVLDAELDGKATQLTLIKDGIQKKSASESLELRPDFGMMATRNGEAIKGKIFSARLEVEPVLSEQDTHVSRRQVAEAHVTLELLK